MLIVHHLGRSQSERVVWLCEELGLDYELICYDRDPKTRLAPTEYRALHPTGVAPIIVDDGHMLAESAAIVEYILVKYGAGRLTVAPDAPDYMSYLHWLHYANGTLQPSVGRCLVARRAGLPAEHPVLAFAEGRLVRALQYVNDRLSVAPYLAGEAFTAADIMTVFSLTTMRLFVPIDLASYPSIQAYLQRIGAREAYQRAMQKGDPGFAPMLN